MKKILSILLSSLLIVACIGMIGCSKIEGKYEFYAIEENGIEYKIGDTLDNGMAAEESAEVLMYGMRSFELEGDGFVTSSGLYPTAFAVWTETEDGIIIKIDLGPIETERHARIDGEKLIIDFEGAAKLVYIKTK